MAPQARSQVPVDTDWDWHDQARCRETDATVFFHPYNARGNSREARERAAVAVCAQCPVRQQCAAYAMAAYEPYGVWGGLTETERETMWAEQGVAPLRVSS